MMRIVVALDGSPHSIQAVEYLAKLPFGDKPSITLATALVDYPYDLVTTESGTALRQVEKEKAHSNFQHATTLLAGRSSEIHHVLERQHPNSLILETAKRAKADLIVLGAHGHSAAYRALLGSTADYVVNHANCSVLLVRTGPERSEPEQGAVSEGFRILLAYDGSEYSQAAVAQCRQFNWPADSSHVHIATLIERPRLVPEEEVYDQDLIRQKEEELNSLCAANHLTGFFTSSVHETLDVGSSLLSLSRDENSNLLFIGGTGRSAFSRFFLGSTSRYLLHHANCSVWIAKETHWSS